MIKTGDIIYCHDAEDMIRTSEELANSDIETDFLYEHKGEKGYFLEITKGEYDEVDGKTIYHLSDCENVVVEYDRYDTCKVTRECLEMLIKNHNEQFRRANTLAILESESKSMENLKMLTQEQHKQLHRANALAVLGSESSGCSYFEKGETEDEQMVDET